VALLIASWATAHLADKQVLGNPMPTSPPDGIINVDRVGQFRHGLIGFLGEPGPSQHVDYFLPGVLHEDNLLTRKAMPASC
jgi:hypothetical protein